MRLFYIGAGPVTQNARRTTNSTERANRWFRKRQKSHYRIRTEPSIRNMLNADLIYRKDRGAPNEPPRRRRRDEF